MSKKIVQYAPLPQTVPSDDEDDIQQSQELGKCSAGGEGSTVEMRNIGTRQLEQKVHYAMGRGRKRCFLLAVVGVCVVVIGLAGGMVFHVLNSSFNMGRVQDIHFSPYGDWMVFYNDSMSESGVVLIDVDGDKQEDVLVGVTSQEHFKQIWPLLSDHSMNESCEKMGFKYPCTSWIVGLRGYDMKELWRTWLRSDLLFVNCHDVDVNGDGKQDCIVTGREASVQAIELATGKVLWVADADDAVWAGHLSRSLSVLRASGIPDVDGDGVVDLIIAQGGEPREAEFQNHDQEAGRVIFLSGATGRPLGRYMEMPQEKETCMSPVAYHTADGSLYFFLGSGGRTTPGDFMVISFPDLHHHIMGSNITQVVPGTNTSQYTWLLGLPRGASSTHILFSGAQKGVVVPPVLADVTRDGIPDILMTAVEGDLILFDGQSLQPVWSKKFWNLESYSIPAPGLFNKDNVLDFMVAWRQGSWPKYNQTVVYILDGEDGKELWSAGGDQLQTTYPLTLRRKLHQDIFLFTTSGRKYSSAVSVTTSEPSKHASLDSDRQKRHLVSSSADRDEKIADGSEVKADMCDLLRANFSENQITCDDNFSSLEMGLHMVDTWSADIPVLVYTFSPEPYRYSSPLEENSHRCHPSSPEDERKVEICVVLIPKSSTGAFGDVDGDGHLDLIQLDVLEAGLLSDHYHTNGVKSNIVLRRVSLTPALMAAGPPSGHPHIMTGSKSPQDVVPVPSQPWRQFMGSSGNCTYRTE